MNKLTLKHLRKLLDHVVYYNNHGPFPSYDTLWQKDIENRIEFMKTTKEEYDDEPVVACKYCKSLHIVADDEDNSHCFRCNSVNTLVEFPNIYKYQEYINGK